MQKNRKRNETPAASHYNFRRTSQRYPLPLPEVVSIDVIGTMLDEDLVVRMRALEGERARVLDEHGDAQPWEEEVAYIRREQQLRRVRRDTHFDFLRRSEEDFNRLEASLPAGDFDNSAFVYAATGGRPTRGWN